MPKTLLILRHAKARKDVTYLTDHLRPLDERGLKDAPRVGQILKKEGLVPDLILTSNAKRAYGTAQLAAEHSGYSGKIREDIQLYSASTPTLMDIVKKIPQKYNTVLLVGHNPDLSSFIHELTKEQINLPTAGLAKITLPISKWKDLSLKTKADLEKIWKP